MRNIMFIKACYFKKILIIGILLLFSANFCIAQQVTPVPAVAQLWDILIKIGVAVCLAVIIWGGIGLIISLGFPDQITEAKEWIIAGVTGLFLILCASAIYTTVTGRPVLFKVEEVPRVEVPELPKKPGVYPYSGKNCAGAIDIGVTQSIEIINKPDKYLYFGAIVQNLDKTCKEYYEPGCHNLEKGPMTITPFLIDRERPILQTVEISLFVRPYLVETPTGPLGLKRGGYKTLWLELNAMINKYGVVQEYPLSEIEVENGTYPCPVFYTPYGYCLSSFETKGNAIVVLYNEINKCEVFMPGYDYGADKLVPGQVGNLRIQKTFSRRKPFKISIVPFLEPYYVEFFMKHK